MLRIDQQTVNALLTPRSVALIGASGDASRLTARPQVFLDKRGFSGKIYPVNPGRDTVLGRRAYRKIADIPERIDHAYVLLDTDAAVDAVEQCAVAGVRVVSVLADGFADAGAQGSALQARLVASAESAGMLLIGPNSTGVVSVPGGFCCTSNAAFAADELPGGRFVVLSQSGSMTGAIASRGAAVGLGFHSYLSVGNEAGAGVGELGEALVENPDIDGFVLFLETIRRPEAIVRFAAAARRAGKPVLAYLVGQSDAGQALAVSHTGAMVGARQALSAFLSEQGIQLVTSLEAMIELTGALTVRQQLAQRPKTVTVVTSTGGGGGMVYDLLGMHGVNQSPPSIQACENLAAQGIHIKPGPLIDLTLAGTRYDVMKAVITALINDPETGLVVAAIGSSAQFDPELSVRPIVDALQAAGVDAAAVVAVPIPHAPESVLLWQAGGVPACRTPDNCAQVVALLLSYMADADLKPAIASDTAQDALTPSATDLLQRAPAGVLANESTVALLASLNIESPGVARWPATDDAPAAPALALPWVLKAAGANLAHKSDLGGVTTGIRSVEELAAACQEMRGRFADHAAADSLQVFELHEQIEGVGEVLVGLTRDPVVGPMISVGMGGVLTEIYADIAMRPAPIAPAGALEMMREVRGFATLRGYRGQPVADLDALARIVSQLSQLAMHPDVMEAELNPVIVRQQGQGAVAVDALVRLAESQSDN